MRRARRLPRNFSINSAGHGYIRRYRIKKDRRWTVESPYGTIDITINLSKPEKDPKAIAAAKNAKQSSYPNASSVWKMKDMPEG